MESEQTKKVYLEKGHLWITKPGAKERFITSEPRRNLKDVYAIPLDCLTPIRQLQWVRLMLDMDWLERTDIQRFCTLAEAARKEGEAPEGPKQ
jgi:hypothetical protein